MDVRVDVEQLCEEVIPLDQAGGNVGLDSHGTTEMDRSEQLTDDSIQLIALGDRLVMGRSKGEGVDQR